MHEFDTVIRLQHTDGAGVVFFARFFELAHLAYEDMLDAIGQPLPRNLGRASLILPIVHAESDYRAALRLGDPLRVAVTVEEIRSRSFTLGYRFTRPDEQEIATLRTVHAAVDTDTGSSTSLPADLVDGLERLRVR